MDRPAFLVQHWPDHLGDAVEHFGGADGRGLADELADLVAADAVNDAGELGRPHPAEVLDGVTEVAGPVLNEEGRTVHEAFGW